MIGIMMVYDITDLESFQNLNAWLIEIEKNGSKGVYKILVGNKSDMESERKVTYQQGKDFADQYGMKFFETSAKNSDNVNEAFITMTREVIKSQSKKPVAPENKKKTIKKTKSHINMNKTPISNKSKIKNKK